MLKFAIEYHTAIATITADRDMKLRKFELGKEEWKVAEELCEVLKVRCLPFARNMGATDDPG